MSEANNSLNDKIIRQVEYYFGDVNLSRDKFLKEEIQKDSGWVALEILTRFNRLKMLSTDYDLIIAALKESNSGLLEIDEANKKVRRAKALPENLSEFETNLKQNTVYVKGFPVTVTLDELYTFFESHGKVLQIFMKKFPGTRQFKGSAFVTFSTNEEMKKFLELESLKYQDSDLTKEAQEDYIARKAPKIERIKESKLKKEQQREEKEKQKKEAEEAFLKEQQIVGAILHLKGFNNEATRENIKEMFDNYASVKYVDFTKGLVEAYVRFSEANKATEAFEEIKKANDGKCALKGADLEGRILEGEEEQEYWKQIVRKLAESRANKKGGRGKRGKNNYNNNKKSYNNNKKRGLEENGGDDDDGDDNDNEQNGDNDSKKVKIE